MEEDISTSLDQLLNHAKEMRTKQKDENWFRDSTEGLRDSLASITNEKQFIGIIQSPYSGKTELLRRFGEESSLIIIPCSQSRILAHFRQSIESNRMNVGDPKSTSSQNFLSQQNQHTIIYHKMRCFFLCYLRLASAFQDLFSLHQLFDGKTILYHNSSVDILCLFYDIVCSHIADDILIHFFNNYCELSSETILDNIHQELKKLKFPIIAFDDAHLLKLQAAGCIFHHNYNDNIDLYKQELLRCMQHETISRLPLTGDLPQALQYSFPTDVLYGFIDILQNFRSLFSSFKFILSSTDIDFQKQYLDMKVYSPISMCNSELVYQYLSKFFDTNNQFLSNILHNAPIWKMYNSRPGILVSFPPKICSIEGIIEIQQEISNELFTKLCTVVQQYCDEENSQEMMQKVLYYAILGHKFQGGILKELDIAPILIKSGIGIWDNNEGIVILNETILEFVLEDICNRMKFYPINLIDEFQSKKLELSYPRLKVEDTNEENFNRIIIQNITAQLYYRVNNEPLQKLFTIWNLDENLLPKEIRESFTISFDYSGTLDEFKIPYRTEYFNSSLNNGIASYVIPSDFPSLRLIARKVSKTSSEEEICFLWFFIKTTGKSLCTGEFISAMNSLSIHKFIPRKASDRHTLLSNFSSRMDCYSNVIHLRFFLCSTGFSSVHDRSISHFNEQYPEQPIFLVQANRIPIESQKLIYGSSLLSNFQKYGKYDKFFGGKTEKKTQTTIELSEFVVPNVNNLVPSLVAKSGSLITSTLTNSERTKRKSNSQNSLPQTKDLNTSSNKRKRKSFNPIHIPLKYRKVE